MLRKFFSLLAANKLKSLLIIAVIIVGGVYAIKKSAGTKNETRYVLTSVTKDTVVTTVTGSGQVSASDQVDLKAKASGDVLTYGMKPGQQIKTGQLLVSINASDALKAVRDAQDNLISAQLSLEKLTRAADPLTLLQSQNSLTASQETKANAVESLKNDYEDGFNTVSSAYLDLPSIAAGIYDTLYGSNVNGSQSNIDAYADAAKRYDPTADVYRNDASAKYLKARASYDAGFLIYKSTYRTSSETEIESLIDRTYDVVRDMSEAVKASTNLIQFYQDRLSEHGARVSSVTQTHLTALSGYTSKTNSELTSLLSSRRSIQDGKASIVSADRSIAERQASLDNVQAPPDEIDLRSAQLTVRQRQETLNDARSVLADYAIRSPFDGVVASTVNLKRGDSISPSTALGTIITEQPIAKLSLNEIDVSKVKVGQKATMTFDVVADLTITGQVVEVDTLGTTTQGVVNYGVKIAFDTSDERIKPGMTVSASIITDSKVDVLVVPNSAIKSANGNSYVETIDGATETDTQDAAGILAPLGTKRVQIVPGLASDTVTEIVSGLKEGDLIVSRTITVSASAPAAANRNILQAAGASGGGVRTGGGGSFRAPGN